MVSFFEKNFWLLFWEKRRCDDTGRRFRARSQSVSHLKSFASMYHSPPRFFTQFLTWQSNYTDKSLTCQHYISPRDCTSCDEGLGLPPSLPRGTTKFCAARLTFPPRRAKTPASFHSTSPPQLARPHLSVVQKLIVLLCLRGGEGVVTI